VVRQPRGLGTGFLEGIDMVIAVPHPLMREVRVERAEGGWQKALNQDRLDQPQVKLDGSA
jgi:hypothetical protein